jgi:hypothetical protein
MVSKLLCRARRRPSEILLFVIMHNKNSNSDVFINILLSLLLFSIILCFPSSGELTLGRISLGSHGDLSSLVFVSVFFFFVLFFASRFSPFIFFVVDAIRSSLNTKSTTAKTMTPCPQIKVKQALELL